MPLRAVLPKRYVHPVDDVNDVNLKSNRRADSALPPPAARTARLVVYMSTTAFHSAGTSFTPPRGLKGHSPKSGVATENAPHAASSEPESTSENTNASSRRRHGRTAVELPVSETAVLAVYTKALRSAPLSDQTRRT